MILLLDVSIPLGDVIILQNDSLSDMVKRVLQEVQIPLDKVRVDQSHYISPLCIFNNMTYVY